MDSSYELTRRSIPGKGWSYELRKIEARQVRLEVEITPGTSRFSLGTLKAGTTLVNGSVRVSEAFDGALTTAHLVVDPDNLAIEIGITSITDVDAPDGVVNTAQDFGLDPSGLGYVNADYEVVVLVDDDNGGPSSSIVGRAVAILTVVEF